MKVIRTIYEHYRYPHSENEQNIVNVYNPYHAYRYKRNFKTFVPSGNGGVTACRLVLDTGEEIVGIAHCNPTDNFNYRLGRRIALGRAQKAFAELYHNDLKTQFDALPFTQNDTDAIAL